MVLTLASVLQPLGPARQAEELGWFPPAAGQPLPFPVPGTPPYWVHPWDWVSAWWSPMGSPCVYVWILCNHSTWEVTATLSWSDPVDGNYSKTQYLGVSSQGQIQSSLLPAPPLSMHPEVLISHSSLIALRDPLWGEMQLAALQFPPPNLARGKRSRTSFLKSRKIHPGVR